MFQNSLPILSSCLLFAYLVPSAFPQDKAASSQLPKLEMVTADRVLQLRPDERDAWKTYLMRSAKLATAEREQLVAELRSVGLEKSVPAPNSKSDFEISTKKLDETWYRSVQASDLASVVLSYQTPSGAWSKSVDYNTGPRRPGSHWTSQSGSGWHYCGTIDNRATTEQILFLAAHYAATGQPASQHGAMAGIEWLLSAQYPSGGWPQVFPLETGYHEAITLNDNAMTHVLEVLLLVSHGETPFDFVEQAVRDRATTAVERGLDCLLGCQVIIDGKRTVWCAQHDPIDLRPVAARAKEPPSLSGAESAELVKFLMRKANDSSTSRLMIESAVKWLDDHQITALRKTKNAAGRTDYVLDGQSTEVYWARFYDLKSQQPIFAGAQDGIIYSNFSEMAKNNKVAYDYFTTKPRDVVTKELQRWKKRTGL